MAARETGSATASRPEQRWADRFRLEAVVDHGLDHDVVERALAEVGAAVADAGVPADELFGAPGEHAREVARAQPVAARADAARDGSLAFFALFSLGHLALVGTLLGALGGRWSVGLSISTTVGAGLLALALVMSGAALHLRRQGLLAASWTAVVVVLALAAATGVALAGDVLDEHVLLQLPMVVLGLVGVALIVAPFVLPLRSRQDRALGRGRSARRWYRRLGGVLRGRYRFPRTQVRDLVAEARSHVAASGALHPSDDLGEPQHHALVLADASTAPAAGAVREKKLGRIATGVMIAVGGVLIVEQVIDEGPSLFTIVVGALIAISLVMAAILRWRRPRPSTSPAGTPQA